MSRHEAEQRLRPHMPVDRRSASLGVLAFLACLLAMQWAKEFLIPILLGLMLSYALTDRFLALNLATATSDWGRDRVLGQWRCGH